MQGNIGVNKRKDLVNVAKSIKIPARTKENCKDIFLDNLDNLYDNFPPIEEDIIYQKENIQENLYDMMDDLKSKVSSLKNTLEKSTLYKNLEEACNCFENLDAMTKGFDKLRTDAKSNIKNKVKSMNLSNKEIKFGAGVLLASGAIAYTISKFNCNKY